MHATVAYLSPELQTFDAVVRLHSQHRLHIDSPSHTTLLSIPPELLLLIRAQLMPLITTHLCELSMAALSQYESSLRNLLCTECRSYNDDIFGSDVWQWENFSGPCACHEIGGKGSRKQAASHSTKCPPRPDPNQFTDPRHWLESYLSCRLSNSPLPSTRIWKAVSDVLLDFGCAIETGNDTSRSSAEQEGGLVSLVNGRRPPAWIYRPRFLSVIPAMTRECGDIRAQAVNLSRARRALGLDYEYPEDLKSKLAACEKGVFRHTSRSMTDRRLVTFKLPFPHSTATIVVRPISVCLAFPLATTTFLLTIMCYYARPGAVRLF